MLQFTAVGRDHIFIPVEAVLPDALQRTAARIVLIHIDKAIALLHFASRNAHQIHCAPGCVANQLHTVIDGKAHLLDVFPQVLDAVIVMHPAILQGIAGAHAVSVIMMGRP